jgi:hypothetical protein
VRRHRCFGIHVALIALIASLGIAMVVPGGASAATFAQVRARLRRWHLRPAPHFPEKLPSSFRDAEPRASREDER